MATGQTHQLVDSTDHARSGLRAVHYWPWLKDAQYFEDDHDNDNDSDDVEDISVHGLWITGCYLGWQAIRSAHTRKLENRLRAVQTGLQTDQSITCIDPRHDGCGEPGAALLLTRAGEQGEKVASGTGQHKQVPHEVTIAQAFVHEK